MFLCEHWLAPCDLSVFKNEFDRHIYWSYMKSSMNPDELIQGRPYGGVGFVCRKMSNILYKTVQCNNDRICSIQIISKNETLVTLFGLYMPHYNGSMEQIELYSETIDELQDMVDACGTPYVIVGDMNATLPQKTFIQRNWHKKRPFNSNSMLMYDFLMNNELHVANFNFNQPVNYTYFSKHAQSYIDHMFISQNAWEYVLDCKIMSDMQDNVSDHFPLCLSVKLPVNITYNDNDLSDSINKFPRINWSDNSLCSQYSSLVCDTSVILDSVSPDSVVTKVDAMSTVNNLCNKITSTMHAAVDELSQAVKSQYKGKYHKTSWWNQNCLIARDRHRFWFNIWKTCNRPREGHIYECHKLAKKTYRTACRKAVNNNMNATYTKMNLLFSKRDSKKLWNLIRVSKK